MLKVTLVVLLGVTAALSIAVKSVGKEQLPLLVHGISPKMNFVTQVGGKLYFADQYTSMDWDEAFNYCTSTEGLKLASINPTEFAALKAAFSYDEFSGNFHTAGKDPWSLKQFTWNTTGEDVHDSMRFESGTGQNINPTCLKFHSEPFEDSYLYADSCLIKSGVLCEYML